MILVYLVPLIVMYVMLRYFVLMYKMQQHVISISDLIVEYKNTRIYSVDYELNMEYLYDIKGVVTEKTDLGVFNGLLLSLNKDMYEKQMFFLNKQREKILNLIRI